MMRDEWNFMKKKNMFLFLVTMITVFLSAICVNAASWPSFSSGKPIKAYTISSGNNTAVYDSRHRKLSNRKIYASDELYISKISNGWVTCTYPTSSGRRTAYIPLGVVTGVSYPTEVKTANAKLQTYRRPGYSSTAGSIYKGDKVYRLGTSGSYTQVLYNIGSVSKPTGWRMAWITTNNYNKYIKGQTSTTNTNTQTIKNGTYELIARCGKCVDVNGASSASGANIQLWERNYSSAQKFKVEYLGNGYYKILNVGSGKAIDVSGGNGTNGTNIQQYTWNNSNAQKWRIVASNTSGYYCLKSAINGKCLDISGGGTANGTNIHLWESNSSDAQKFRFVATSASSKPSTPSTPSSNSQSTIQRLISYERSQVGTSENGNNNIIYNTWYYGKPVKGTGYAWCQAFQSYCMNKCGISTSIVPKENGCTRAMNWFKSKGQWQWSKYWGGKYTPKAGDLVFYGYSKTSSSHVGLIVASPSNGYLQVIEGNVNMGDGKYKVVEFKSNSKRTVSSSYVIGYGTPAYK